MSQFPNSLEQCQVEKCTIIIISWVYVYVNVCFSHFSRDEYNIDNKFST